MKYQFELQTTAMGPNGSQSLLVVRTPEDEVIPALSVQVPTEIGDYIVTACNAFPDLVAALKLVDAELGDLFASANPQYKLIGKRVRAALAKAGAA